MAAASALALHGMCSGAGKLFVCDTMHHKVAVLSLPELSQLRTIGLGEGKGEGQLDQPCAVAFIPGARGGELFVLEQGNSRVSVFSSTDGTFKRHFGGYGRGAGQLSYPRGIAVCSASKPKDSGSFVLVADTDNHRIVKFTTTGEYVETWPPGPQLLQVARPTAPQAASASAALASATGADPACREVVLDGPCDIQTHAGQVYIGQTGVPNVCVLTLDGKLAAEWRVDIRHAFSPMHVCVEGRGPRGSGDLLYVTDSVGKRLCIMETQHGTTITAYSFAQQVSGMCLVDNTQTALRALALQHEHALFHCAPLVAIIAQYASSTCLAVLFGSSDVDYAKTTPQARHSIGIFEVQWLSMQDQEATSTEADTGTTATAIGWGLGGWSSFWTSRSRSTTSASSAVAAAATSPDPPTHDY